MRVDVLTHDRDDLVDRFLGRRRVEQQRVPFTVVKRWNALKWNPSSCWCSLPMSIAEAFEIMLVIAPSGVLAQIEGTSMSLNQMTGVVFASLGIMPVM